MGKIMGRKYRGGGPETPVRLAKEITERVMTCMGRCGTQVSADAQHLCYETVIEALENSEASLRSRGDLPPDKPLERPATIEQGDRLKELAALLQETEACRRAAEDGLVAATAHFTKSLKLATATFDSLEIDTALQELHKVGRVKPPRVDDITRCADRLTDLLFKQTVGREEPQKIAALEDEVHEQDPELSHLQRELYRREIELGFERDRAERIERVNVFLAETIREITKENERLEGINSRISDLMSAVESGRVSRRDLDGLINDIRNQIMGIVRKFKEAMERTTRHMSRLEQELEGARREKGKKIEQLEQQLSTAEQKARTDDLTGIASRRWFDEVISSMIRNFDRRHPFSLLLIDIDGFKEVNDRHGHQFGDNVLQKVATIVRDSFRHTDTTARYGGEEFAVILPDADLQETFALAEKLRARIAGTTFRYRLLKKKGKRLVETDTVLECTITISAGAATAQSGDDVATLIRRADAALYLAKGSGRNSSRTEADLPPEMASERIKTG